MYTKHSQSFHPRPEHRSSYDKAVVTSSMKRRGLQMLAFCGVAFRVYSHALQTAMSKTVHGWLAANSVPSLMSSSYSWLVVYFAFNLVLTIYNKLVLAGGFPFPYMLTAVHCLFGTVGSSICLKNRVFTQARLTQSETIVIGLFSVLYTINIIVSNASLQLVTVPFHQIIRSTTPLFVIAISVFFLSKSYSSQTYLSLIPVIIGVALATAGDYYFTRLGFLLTLFGTLLAAVKTVLTNRIQKSMSSPLHPLDVLLRMSPLACLQSLFYAFLFGEFQSLITYLSTLSLLSLTGLVIKLSINGMLAFGLNYVSFTANKKTSPLTMTVAANLKQCFLIIVGIWVFRLRVGWMNGLGIIIALAGGAWYAKVEFGIRSRVKLDQLGGQKFGDKEIV